MPTLRATIGAFLAAATGVDSPLEGLRVLYPQGYLPLPEAPGAPPLDLVLRANMVPPPGVVFRPSSQFLFDVYRDVLDSHRLVEADAEETSARRVAFARARARMGDGSVTPGDLDYYPVDLVPEHLGEDSSWTGVTLGPTQVTALDASLTPQERDWLERYNLLDELGDGFVASATLELASVDVVRRWFDPDVLTWDFWDIDGPPLSDSGEPGAGRLPAYVVRFVAARRFVVTLGPVELPTTSGVIYRRLPGADASAPLAPGDVLAELSGARAGGDAGTSGAAGLDARGYLKLHVPFRFDTSQALPVAQGALAAAQGALSDLEARGALPVLVRDHRRGRIAESMVPLLTTRAGDSLRTQIDAARAVVRAKAEAVALLTRLGDLDVDPAPHVVAIGCAVVPACPRSRFAGTPSDSG